MINFVLPSTTLPKEHLDLMESIDHNKIGSDVRIIDMISDIGEGGVVILRTSYHDFVSDIAQIGDSLKFVERLNICFTDTETFEDEDIPQYSEALTYLVNTIFEYKKSGLSTSINIITDRIGKSQMNNCGAGVNNITVAPNGKFYLCPAFYYDEQQNIDNLLNHHSPDSARAVGDLDSGLSIPNKDLLCIDHAPICRICDAYHCRRCVWLNQKLTGDINTPSHQQCVMAHLERNAARKLELLLNKELGGNISIPEINYIDPIDLILRK